MIHQTVVVLGATLAVLLLGSEPASAQEQKHEDEVWITVASARVDPIRRAFSLLGLKRPLELIRTQGDLTVARIRRQRIPLLARFLHKESRRCAGFIAHPTYERALQALTGKFRNRATGTKFVDYSIDNRDVAGKLVAAVDEARIAKTIVELSSFENRYYRTQGGVDAARWVHDRWHGLAQARDDVSVELFEHDAYPQPSVILTIEGSEQSDEVVVIGGHVDSIVQADVNASTQAPGADDNASGIATATEVLRVAMAQDYRPARTVKFMAYAAEEVGLRGSGDIASSFQENQAKVVGVIQLDMTNYNGSKEDIVLMRDYTNAAQNQFLTDLIATYLGPDVSWAYDECGYACSDHASWTNAGYPASMPFEAHTRDMNPHIHSDRDTLSASDENASHALKFARLTAAFMAELAKGTLAPSPR